MKSHLSLAFSLLLLAGCASAQLYSGEQRAVIQPKATGYPYLMFVPKHNVPRDRGQPLLIFLHGSGERGSDIALVKIHGPPKLCLLY
ncbi:MAG: hypothetical protein ABL893_15555, partial [Hyphomicrobium sp.]